MDTNETIVSGPASGPENLLKSCPTCGSVFPPDRFFCSNDGSSLVGPTDPKICPRCHRGFERTKRYCSHDGARLVDYLPGVTPAEATLDIGGVSYGVRRLENEEKESFSRSLCPHCGDWKNWKSTEIEYVCNGCGSAYCYGSDGVLEILGLIGPDGVLIPRKVGGGMIRMEKTPMEELLQAMSPSKRTHWMNRFSLFEEGKFNLSWNWPSFFFGPLRYFSKGIWIHGILYTAGAGFVLGVMAEFWFEHFLLWYVLNGTFFGIMGSNDYYKFCLKYRDDIPGARKAKNIGTLCFWLLLLSPIILPIIVMSVKGI